MKRVFSVEIRRVSANVLHGSRTFEVVSGNAIDAIEKAINKFRKEKSWNGGVVVQSLYHRGPAI